MKRIGVEGELLRHEADLDDWANAVVQQTVVDLIDVGEVVDGIAVFVFVVDADLIVQDGVEANVAEVRDSSSRRARSFAIALAQGQDGAA